MKCNECNGKGFFTYLTLDRNDLQVPIECTACGGKGHKTQWNDELKKEQIRLRHKQDTLLDELHIISYNHIMERRSWIKNWRETLNRLVELNRIAKGMK